ncbi:hypothetical protein [Staphylococcus haemolyticus]|uniref:hypothetical protein n=1 Tax=Staphylococcus haemolyticus TaxID=1283 RepID=UPI000D1D623E|nr:hypothetical protein [Staphylococcus haemolyticus]PTK81939.1 hypothetical protein BUZ16_09455 [Staphylococcus haemolyticus]PTL13655.1 hypothetical protein BUZ30_12565 [Staphylococcus haemolyticus]
MKKALFLIFASVLVLSACGQDEDNSNKESNKKSETKSDKKSNDPKKNNASDNKEKTSEDKQQANSDDNSNSETRNRTENTYDNNGGEKQGSSKSYVGQQQKPTNNGQQQADSNQQQTSNNQQQVSQNQQNQQVQEDPNAPTYQEYLNAKELTENIQNNPDKYQHIGGGPGMGLSSPDQSYDSYKQEVTKARNESQTLQQ